MTANNTEAGRKSPNSGIIREACRFFKATPYAISLIWGYQPVLLVILAVSTVLDGLSPAVTVWIMRYFLDAVVLAYQREGQAPYVKRALYILVLQIVVTGGLAGVSKGMSFFKAMLASKLSLAMQADLINGMSRLEMKDYDNPEIYDMIARARNEAQNNKPLAIVSGVCDITSSFITWLSFTIVLFGFSSLVVGAMLAICIPYLILNVLYGRANFQLQYGRTHEQRAAGYFSLCFTDRRSLPEIITLGLWSFLRNKWHVIATRLMRQDLSLLKRRTLSEIAIIVLTYFGRGGVSVYIIFKCLMHSAEYTIGQLMMFLQAFSGGVNALAQMMQQLSGVYEGSCFLQTYQQFLEVQKDAPPERKPQRKVPEVIESIECRDVSFRYPGAETYALQDINLLFKRGQSTLLVGRNGAGKTTLARLLVGLYKPTHGTILVNGCDMGDYDLTQLRKRMSIIFQDFVRYALTAEENIGVGLVERIDDRQRIVHAAQAARVDGILMRLPKGYGTMLGREYRDGVDLSLGEWQRLCLARMFMRGTSVTVYDEPSASLDVETESELLREISVPAKNGICLLISHRMLRADIADRIIVMEEGRIVEHGSHDALVAMGGRYAHLWRTYYRLSGNGELSDERSTVEQ